MGGQNLGHRLSVRERVKPQTPKSCLRLCNSVLVSRRPSSSSALPFRVPPPTSPAQPVLRTVPRNGSKRPRPSPSLPLSCRRVLSGWRSLLRVELLQAVPHGGLAGPGALALLQEAGNVLHFGRKSPGQRHQRGIRAAGSARSLPAPRRAGHAGSAPRPGPRRASGWRRPRAGDAAP